jgi:multidrug efflux pump
MALITYFLNHPIRAVILNCLIFLVGFLCFQNLNLREYPDITFSKVRVSTSYPNASAEVIENEVTNLLENKLSGIGGLDKITSKSSYGRSNISLTFKQGVSIDRSLLSIHEAINTVSLPKDVKPPLVERQTASENISFIILALKSDAMSLGELTHYANLNLSNVFRSIEGVAKVEIWGPSYVYKVVLNAHKMYSFGVNADEVVNALQKANLSIPVGEFQNSIPVTLKTELKSISDIENLIIRDKKPSTSKKKPSSSPVLLKHLANVFLTTEDEKFNVKINGQSGICIAIDTASDANPLKVSELIKIKLQELKVGLNDDVEIEIISDQADFIRASVKNIKSSIFEAIIFVLLIVFFFLRNLKATLAPLITIPISLMGSFIALKLFGFSINILTLMGLVLAVGLVVDDAIVVLENIERHIRNKLSPLEAALKGANEIGFAIVAMTLTLTSVYAPLIFIDGIIGQLFTEFAVALASSVIISGVVALTISPFICAKTLSMQEKHLWPQIDLFLIKLTDSYKALLSKVISYKKIGALLLVCSFGLIAWLFYIIPKQTAPSEDRSLVGAYLPRVAGKDIKFIASKVDDVEGIFKTIQEGRSIISFVGSWGAQVLLPLKPLNERNRSSEEILNFLRSQANNLPSIDVHPWSFDSGIPGVDTGEDSDKISLIVSTTDNYKDFFYNIEQAKKALELSRYFQFPTHDLNLDKLNYKIDLDKNEIAGLGLNFSQIAKMIEIFFSGDDSINFVRDGILYPISVKGDKSPWGLDEIYITNSDKKRIALSTFAKMVNYASPNELFHYNQMRATKISASSDFNISDATNNFLKIVKDSIPSGYKITLSGSSSKNQDSQNNLIYLFGLSIIFIFGILSFQFENFSDPLIILFTVPLACLGALFLVWILGGSINIYTQIGLITLVGLITKHGILIVEFANSMAKTKPMIDSVLEAASLRLRPILMTTGAMMFGAIPLLLSSDAGYEARREIAAVLIGGLSFGTILTLFILPTIYVLVKNVFPPSC